jgi:hypothetical protein
MGSILFSEDSTNSVLAVIEEHDRVMRQCRQPNELPAMLSDFERPPCGMHLR